MTLVKNLIHSLQGRNPEAQVFLMTQRKQPFENVLAGVVGREEMADQRWRIEPGVETDDVFLVVGKRIRPGSLSAWFVAENREATAVANDDTDEPQWQARLTQLAWLHLRVETLHERGDDDLDVHMAGVGALRAALTAAYRSGISAGIRHTVAVEADDPDAEPAQAAPTEAPVTGSEEASETASEAPEAVSHDAETAHDADAATV